MPAYAAEDGKLHSMLPNIAAAVCTVRLEHVGTHSNTLTRRVDVLQMLLVKQSIHGLLSETTGDSQAPSPSQGGGTGHASSAHGALRRDWPFSHG